MRGFGFEEVRGLELGKLEVLELDNVGKSGFNWVEGVELDMAADELLGW